MAESATQARRGRRGTTEASEDSIDAEFGGDYSEASLEALRQLGRKGAQFGEIEPAELQATQPPSQEVCDQAVAELQEYERSLEELKQYVPDAKERAWVDYKRALVEDATPEEVTWLKLKAYHHGLGVLRSFRGGDAPSGDALAAPTSCQPAEDSLASARDAVLRAARNLLTSSGDGEDDGEGGAWGFAASSQTGNRAVGRPAAQQLSVPVAAAAAVPVTVYTADYLEEQRLSRRVAQQRQERARAFGASLAVALGASVVRWWLRRGRAGNGGAPRRTPAPLAQ